MSREEGQRQNLACAAVGAERAHKRSPGHALGNERIADGFRRTSFSGGIVRKSKKGRIRFVENTFSLLQHIKPLEV